MANAALMNRRFGEFFTPVQAWLAQGRIKYREDIVDGLDGAPQAFLGLLEGRNDGKLVVRVHDTEGAGA
jgi:NADPH-dependent curcumin reductase CurA